MVVSGRAIGDGESEGIELSGTYAATTSVPVSKSRTEIEETLARFGASGFGYFNRGDQIQIAFEIDDIRVVMKMNLPDKEQFRRDKRGYLRMEHVIEKDWEQSCRQRWRTLANGVKAKLALVDDGISTIEREFLSDIALPDGSTVGDRIVPTIRETASTGLLPSLMPGKERESKVIAIGGGR